MATVRQLPPPLDSLDILEWNLTSHGGGLLAAGLYRAQITGHDPTGRPFSPQLVYFGVVGSGPDVPSNINTPSIRL